MPGSNLSLSLSQRQIQTLAPQLRQSLKLLQMGVMELNQEIRAQMAENPVIDSVTSPAETSLSSMEKPSEDPFDGKAGEFDDESPENMPPSEREMDFTAEGLAAEESLAESPDRDYFLSGLENADYWDDDSEERRRHFFDSRTREETLQEHLVSQLHLVDVDDLDRALAEDLVGHLDESGFFTGSVPDVAMVWEVPESRVRAALALLRTLDPLGCGSETARECLLAQMEKLDGSPHAGNVRRIVEKYLPDLAAHREHAVREALGLSERDFAAALAELRRLDPAPGRNFPSAAERVQYVEPEVFAVKKDGRYVAVVPTAATPRIRISERYRRLAVDPSCDPETRAYVRERLRAAETLREALEKRVDTIRAIAQAICDRQSGYFDRGPEAFRPLKMSEIASAVGVHETTVSRTVGNKYMKTPLGVKLMRDFFGSGLSKEDGGETSAVAVKNRIRAMVGAEKPDSPLSDDSIAGLLRAEGVNISRRTVAKYRMALKIACAKDRRRG